jgi:fatty acid desaturase
MNDKNINKTIKELSKINDFLGLKYLVLDWFIIFMTIYLAVSYNSILFNIISIIIIGSRQHAIGILSHDAVHYRFLSNRKMNEFIGNVFTAFPLFITIPGFRSMHLRHHSKVNSEEDPDLTRRAGKSDWIFPMTRKKIYTMLLFDITGLNLYQNIQKIFLPKSDKKLRADFKNLPKLFYLGQLSFYILLFSIISFYEVWGYYFLYWVVPYFTWFKFTKRLRAIGEHFAIKDENYKELTRTTLVGFFEGHLISPHNINYHIEHHFNASIPFYNLDKLHDILINNGKLHKMGKVQIDGYLIGVLSETQGECGLNAINTSYA